MSARTPQVNDLVLVNGARWRVTAVDVDDDGVHYAVEPEMGLDWVTADALTVLDAEETDRDTLRRALRWALTGFAMAMQERTDRDRAQACAANGWRMSDASDLYDRAVTDILALTDGEIDPAAYLERSP